MTISNEKKSSNLTKHSSNRFQNSSSAVHHISGPTDQSIVQINLNQFRERSSGIDGRGSTIVVIDSGIDLDNSAFGSDTNGDGVADRIVYSYDFSGINDADASTVDSHGSIVSRIAATVAPGANIIHLKVFPDGKDSAARTADIQEALQWVIDHTAQYNIVSVNLSLSAGDNVSRVIPASRYGDEFAQLSRQGVAVVTAAGNGFAPGVDFGVSGLSADPHTISVGAVWDGSYGEQFWGDASFDFTTGRDRVISFSQRHAKLLDIFAPGSLVKGTEDGKPEVAAGTSFAAPYVSGAVALAQEFAVQELGRRLTVPELTQLLKTTGATIYDGDDEFDSVTNTDAAFSRLDVMGLSQGILTAKAGRLPTAQNDRLSGTSGNDYLSGFDGHDGLLGHRGQDTLVGGAGRDRLQSGQSDDLLFGGEGDDRLVGGADSDWLAGDAGQDYLKGGANADQFFFQSRKAGGDIVADFDAAEGDQIVVSAKGFGGRLETGVLSKNQFSLGSDAANRNTRLIYEAATGNLFFDADGTGSQKQTLIANFKANSVLSSHHISVVA